MLFLVCFCVFVMSNVKFSVQLNSVVKLLLLLLLRITIHHVYIGIPNRGVAYTCRVVRVASYLAS